MHLSPRRIGWSASNPLLWIDDKGIEHSLLYTTPSMVCFLLERGVQRHHERVLAKQLGWPSGARVCVEPLRRIVNPRTKGIRLSAQGKYLVKTAFCE
eukprot:991178-Pyramimonas_sp.AAC.1